MLFLAIADVGLDEDLSDFLAIDILTDYLESRQNHLTIAAFEKLLQLREKRNVTNRQSEGILMVVFSHMKRPSDVRRKPIYMRNKKKIQ